MKEIKYPITDERIEILSFQWKEDSWNGKIKLEITYLDENKIVIVDEMSGDIKADNSLTVPYLEQDRLDKDISSKYELGLYNPRIVAPNHIIQAASKRDGPINSNMKKEARVRMTHQGFYFLRYSF